MDVTILNCKTKYLIKTSFSGFSFIELLITLALSSTALAITVPGLRGVYISTQNTVNINRLIGDMAYTRTEAIKRVTDVILCKSSDGQFCTNNGGWESGWIIFVDTDQNQLREQNETLLRVQDELHNTVSIKYNGFKSNHYISFRPSGRTEMNGTFRFCINNSAYNKELILSKTGRVRLHKRKQAIIDNNREC